MSVSFFQSVELSDIGKKRKNNEDACLRVPERGLYFVADGMGGGVGGEVASKKVVTVLSEAFAPAATGPESLPGRVALFQTAANAASKWIRNFAEEKTVGQMGSTIVAVIFDPLNPKRAMALHAGDSRLYRFRQGMLQLLTEDHTAIEVLAKKLGRDRASLPAKYQNELIKAVGLAETVELEKRPVDAASGDLFLLCCDGLTHMLTDEKIRKILAGGAELPVTARKLIDAANEAGGKDNITVILIKMGDLGEFPETIELEERAAPEVPTPPTRPDAVESEADARRDTPATTQDPVKVGIQPTLSQ